MRLLLIASLTISGLFGQRLTLDWGTYLGIDVSNNRMLHGRDSTGNLYVATTLLGPSFRSTLEPYRWNNLYIAKLDPSGKLIWGTYYGGSSTANLGAFLVDEAGNSYLAGGTGGEDSRFFPSGGGFLLSLDGNGRRKWVQAAFWLPTGPGEMSFGRGGRLAYCSFGHVFATNVPVPNEIPSIQRQRAGNSDGMVVEFEPNGQIGFATYYGGSGTDMLSGCAYGENGIIHTAVTTQAPSPFEKGLLGIDVVNRRKAYYTPFEHRNSVSMRLHNQKVWVVGGVGGSLGVTADAAVRAPFETQATGRNPFLARFSSQGELEYATYVGAPGALHQLIFTADGTPIACGIAETAVWPVSRDALDSALLGPNRATLSVLNARGEIQHSTYLNSRGEGSSCHAISWHSGKLLVTGGAGRTLVAVAQPVEPLASQDRPNRWAVQLNLQVGLSPRFTAAGVTNAASFAGGPIAPGEILTVFAQDAGPEALAGIGLTSERRVSTVTGNTRVLFDGTPGPMIYAVTGQISTIVPYNVAGKTQVQMVVEYNNVPSAPVTVPVAATAPGLFTVAGGTGQVVALQESGCCNSAANPARRGEVIVLYATGEGQTNPPGRDGSLAEYATLSEFPRPVLPVRVLIGGQQAEILYAGAAPGFVAGLMQINLRVPEGSPVGEAVGVVLQVGSASSRAGVTMAVR